MKLALSLIFGILFSFSAFADSSTTVKLSPVTYLAGGPVYETKNYKTTLDKNGNSVEILDNTSRYTVIQIQAKITKAQAELTKLQADLAAAQAIG